jgi:uncharacterized glyoxalase superfamily protein PhnB
VSYNPAEGFDRIMPGRNYSDVDAALRWLADAFGFTEVLRWNDPESGLPRHCEMRYGDNAFIEVSDGTHDEGLLVIVDDVDAHYANAKAKGAEIVTEPADRPWGLRQYSCRDIEGKTWGFGQWLRDVAPEEWGATVSS